MDQGEVYEHDLHLCTKVDGELMAAFLFETKYLRRGMRKPTYIVFMDRRNEDFITYDVVYQKWRTATLERLFPVWNVCGQIFVTEKEKAVIRDFFQTEEGDSRDISRFQMGIREKQLEIRHKKETDPWDEEMELVPAEFPKDWNRWLAKSAVRQHFIFYQYKKNVQEGYCSWCEKTVPVSKPRHNKMGRCVKCGHIIQYKAAGRAGRFRTDHDTAYLFQRCEDRIILRSFSVQMDYCPGKYQEPVLHCWEEERIFLDAQMQEHTYYYGVYKNRESRWIGVNKDGRPSRHCYAVNGAVYRRNLPALNRTFMKKTGIYEMVCSNQRFDPLNYLAYRIKYPYMERLVKADLIPLARELLQSRRVLEIEERGDLGKCLKLDQQLLKRLRRNKGGVEYMEWLQMEKRQGKQIPDEMISWFQNHQISADRLAFVEDRMSAVQIYHYLVRQAKEMGQNYSQVLIMWRDYLSMAERLGMDVKDDIIYRTAKLKKRHDEAVLLLEKKNLEEEAEKMRRRYPEVDGVCREIREKYEYMDDEKYAVLVPNNLFEVMQEGRTLHHCVGNEERYYDRMNRQESYILFLRQKSDLTKAYYTLEVEPDGTVRQKRKEYNRQGKEIEELDVFLRKWQEVVRQRMTAADVQRAMESRKLREEEFARMHEKAVVIHGGEYAGRLLANVLQADLIESVPAETEKAA
ncbi:MAG: PcfJ domain-containing protein [Frisingicoccus sp.]